MTEIQLTGLFLNFIIYLIMIFPVIIISLNKKNYENKNHFISIVIFSFIIEIILSFSLYKFSPNIFSFFSNTPGIVNYSVYASKILFISSSLFGIKILFPIYLIQNNMKKKSAILVLAKMTVLLTAMSAAVFFAGFYNSDKRNIKMIMAAYIMVSVVLQAGFFMIQ